MANENLTTYTEVDPGGRFAVTSSAVTVTSLPRTETAYVYDDKGVDFIDGDFEYLIDVEFTAMTPSCVMAFCCLANDIGDFNGLITGAKSNLNLYAFETSAGVVRKIILREQDGSSGYQDTWDSVLLNTPYYLTMARDESVGSYGQITCEIYDDANRTSLVDTLSLLLHSSKKDFRYVYATQSANNGGAATMSGTISNLDLQGVAEAVGNQNLLLMGVG